MISTAEKVAETDERFEWYMGQLVQALIDAGHPQYAARLIVCHLTYECELDIDGREYVSVTLIGPFGSVGTLAEPDPKLGTHKNGRGLIEAILRQIFPPNVGVPPFSVQVESTLPLNWREELLLSAQSLVANNQGVQIGDKEPIRYNNLRFRSRSEIRIARALDAKNITYFPLCMARVTKGGERVNREPDFLICDQGRWGILECDGPAYHPPTSAYQDHERDRVFRSCGVKVVERYSAERCYQEPEQVVTEFLDLLFKNG